MAWSPISNTVPQYAKNAGGASASGYYLKFYASGTTTPINMAEDSTGASLLAKCQLNSEGYPINGSSDIFIPHIDQDYKLALYTNTTDADNNTFASAAWIVDAIRQSDNGLRQDLIATNGTANITHSDNAVDYFLSTYLQNRYATNLLDYSSLVSGGDWTSALAAAVSAASGGNRRLYAPAGTYTHQAITISAPIWIIGDGEEATIFSSHAGIGQNNMFYANGVDGIAVTNCGFNMNNDTISSIQTDSYLENIFCFVSCSNVFFTRNKFQKSMHHNIIFNGASGAENENIYINNNRFENGIKGGVIMVRYNRNVHVKDNKMTNVCDDSKVVSPAASTGYKSIGVDGVVNAWIEDNDILQDNGSVSGTIIVEYQDRQSENVHVKGNTVDGGSNGIKVGPSVGVKVLDNNCLNSGDMGIYSEGAYEIEIAHNYVENADQNAVRIFEDAQTGRLNRNVKVHHNTFKNSNVGGATLGNSSTGAVGSDQSYHVACRQASDIYIKDNIFIDDGASTAGGVYMAADDYYIEDNNFLQMKAGTTVTIYNTAPATGTHRIANNAGARTEAKGIATIASGTSSITVNPDVVSEVTNAMIQISLNEPLTGTAVYAYAAISGTGQFDIVCMDSSHATANVSTPTDFTWSYSVTDAVGTFGLTTK